MKRYRTVVFDLDGTLVDSYDALHQSVNDTRARFGLEPLPLGAIKSMVGDGLGSLLERVFFPGEVPEDATPIFEAHYDSVCCSASHVLEGVEETLRSLYDSGIAMAICTNKPTSFSKKIVEYLGLSPMLRDVVGPDVAGTRKPDGRHLTFTIERADGDVESSLYVGDMTVDIEAARNAGVPVAVIPTGAVTLEILKEADADYYLERFEDLERIVLGAGR